MKSDTCFACDLGDEVPVFNEPHPVFMDITAGCVHEHVSEQAYCAFHAGVIMQGFTHPNPFMRNFCTDCAVSGEDFECDIEDAHLCEAKLIEANIRDYDVFIQAETRRNA